MPFNLKIYSENFEDYTDRPAELRWTDPYKGIYTDDYPTMFREKNGKTLYIKYRGIEDLEIKSKVYNIRSYSNANGADSNLFFSKTYRSQSTEMEAFSPFFEIQLGDSISFDVRNLDVDSDRSLLDRSYKANIKIVLNGENGTDEQELATYSGIERSFIPFKANATVAGKYRLKITAYTYAFEYGDISNVTDADADISIDNVIISRGSIIELNKESVSEGDDFSVIIRPPLPSVGEQLYYKITGADKYDVLSNQISGKTLVGNNNTALINISIVKDLKTEGNEEWELLLYEDPEFTKIIAEPIVINILDISKTPSFEQGYSYKSEGSDIQLTITSSEYDVGYKLYYALSGNGITESDFDSKKLTGDVTLQKDGVKLLIRLANDLLTEGDENVEIIFYSDADRSIEITHSNYSKYARKIFEIGDTSKSPPSYKVTSIASSIDEGEELKFTISSKDFVGYIYWSILGDGVTSNDFERYSYSQYGDSYLYGYRYLSENEEYIITRKIRSDQLREGPEKIELKLFSDSENTVQLGETSVVIINDTSLPRETILPEQIQDGFLDLDNGEDPILMWKGKFLNIDDVKDWNKSISGEIRNADTGQIIDLSLYNIHVAQDGSFEFAIDLENASSGDWDFSEFYVAGNGYWNPELYIKVYPTEKNKYNEEKEVGLSELANNLELGIPKFKVQNKNADMVAPTIKSYKLPSQLNDGILDIDAGESSQLVYEFSIEDPFTDTNRASGFSKINFGFQDSFYNDASFELDASIGVVKATIDATYLKSGPYELERFGIEDIEGNSYGYASSRQALLTSITDRYYTRDEYYNSKKDLTKEEFTRLSGIDPEAGPFKFTVKNTNPPKPQDLPPNANGKLDKRVESLSLPTQFSDGIIDLDGGESPNLELKIKLTALEGQDGISVPQFYFTNKITSKRISLFGDPVFTLPTDLVLSADANWLTPGEYFLSSSYAFDSIDGDYFYYNRSKDDKELDIKAKQDKFQQETGIDLSSGNFDFSVKNSKIDSRSPVIKLETFSIPNQFTSGEAIEIPISGTITDLNLDGTAGSGLKNFWISYSLDENYFYDRSFTVTQADLDLKGAFLKPFYLSDLQPGKWSLYSFGLIDNAGNEDSYRYQSYLNRQERLNDKFQFKAKTGIDIDQFQSFLVTSPIQNQGPATFAVSGTFKVGQVLTVAKTADDPDGNGTFSYQWQSSTDGNTWSNIGSNAATYTLTAAEQSKQIQVQISYTDAQNFQELITVSAGTVGVFNDGAATFAVSGTFKVGQVLTVAKTADDPDGNGTFSYQWQSSTDGNTWSELVSKDASDNNISYFLTAAEANKTISAVVTYLDTEGNNEVVNSVASEYIAIVPATYSVTTSAAKINEASTLTATLATTNVTSGIRLYYSLSGVGITSNDIGVGYITGVVKVDNEGTAKFSVQFLNDLATEGTEILEIKFFKDNVFSEQLGSTAYVVIEDSSTKLNIAPTGRPTVRGNPKPGSILTISDSTINDSDNLNGYKPEFEYNWETSIDGINWSKLNTADALDNNNTYLLTAADVNKQIRAIASYTDGYGTFESISSEASSKLGSHQNSDELIGKALDFNGDDNVDDFDSILMMRHMMGTFPGDSIKRDMPGKFELTAIQSKLINAFSDISFDGSLRLDIDGDKRISAFRDGMMITQHIHKQGISDSPWAPPGFNPPAGFFAQMQQHLKDLIEF